MKNRLEIAVESGGKYNNPGEGWQQSLWLEQWHCTYFQEIESKQSDDKLSHVGKRARTMSWLSGFYHEKMVALFIKLENNKVRYKVDAEEFGF